MNQDIEIAYEQLRGQVSELRTRADEVNSVATDMAAVGAGKFKMYGVLVGALAYPMLSSAADQGEQALRSLADMATAMSDNLTNSANEYEAIEENNAQISEQISKILGEM